MNPNLLYIPCLVGLLLSVAAVCQQVAYAQAPITVYRLTVRCIGCRGARRGSLRGR